VQVAQIGFVVAELLVVLICVTVHEASHAWAADKLGDPTARLAGRLSLNPIRHIDPVGTVLVPIVLAALGGPVFGWAKPVGINPMRFRNPREGMMLSALAGPGSNLLLAGVLGLGARIGLPLLAAAPIGVAFTVALLIRINLILATFNLIPLPPLDGSRVVPVLLPPDAARTWDSLERYGMLIVLLLIVVAPQLLGFSPISAYFEHVALPLERLLLGPAQGLMQVLPF
jgi:Zn-dependent protease